MVAQDDVQAQVLFEAVPLSRVSNRSIKQQVAIFLNKDLS